MTWAGLNAPLTKALWSSQIVASHPTSLLSIDTYRALTDPEESLGAAFTGMFDDKLDDVEFPRAMTEKPQAAQLD